MPLSCVVGDGSNQILVLIPIQWGWGQIHRQNGKGTQRAPSIQQTRKLRQSNRIKLPPLRAEPVAFPPASISELSHFRLGAGLQPYLRQTHHCPLLPQAGPPIGGSPVTLGAVRSSGAKQIRSCHCLRAY